MAPVLRSPARRGGSGAGWRGALALTAALIGPGERAIADDASPVPATWVENCAGPELIELHAGADSAMLDAADRAQVHAAMMARYAQLRTDGFAPSAIMLWRSPSFGWVYLALNSHPEKPGKVCCAATFSAPPFEFTGTLLRKYFFAGRT